MPWIILRSHRATGPSISSFCRTAPCFQAQRRTCPPSHKKNKDEQELWCTQVNVKDEGSASRKVVSEQCCIRLQGPLQSLCWVTTSLLTGLVGCAGLLPALLAVLWGRLYASGWMRAENKVGGGEKKSCHWNKTHKDVAGHLFPEKSWRLRVLCIGNV